MALGPRGGAYTMVKRLLAVAVASFIFLNGYTLPSFNESFDERVKSLKAYNSADPYSVGIPTLTMGRNEGLVVEFDILGDDRDYLRYELVHCDLDWQPSKLSSFEAVEGMNEGHIEDCDFSMATTVPYVHYRLDFPNEEVSPKVSGNYIIRIYNETDPETTLANVGFRVSEGLALIGSDVTTHTDVDYNREHQQLSVSVNLEDISVGDMFNDIVTVIEQNGSPLNRHYLTKPLRVSGPTLIYEHLKDLIFQSGNEYHRFETVWNQQPGMGVEAIEYHSPYYNHYLITDVPKNGMSYQYDETLRGGYVVREYNSAHSDTEADYVVVHFSLEMPEMPRTDVFIDSEAFRRELSPESMMNYNRVTRRYEKSALLKQGAYSFRYVTVPRGEAAADKYNLIDGNKFQTVNVYDISVYNRRPGERYDRLIGTTKIISGQPIY